MIFLSLGSLSGSSFKRDIFHSTPLESPSREYFFFVKTCICYASPSICSANT
nr:MAG TPA: POLLEN ALLERGEN 5 ALLERGEN, SMALL HIGHLY DISULFIDE [Caudoviricetes sp.]